MKEICVEIENMCIMNSKASSNEVRRRQVSLYCITLFYR